MMMPLVCGVIAESSPAEVGLGHQAKPFQQFEGAVYGGDVYVGVFVADLSVYFLSTDMVVAAVYCGKYHPSLRCHPVALFSQSLGTTHLLAL